MTRFALVGATIFDGATRHHDRALIVSEGRIAALAALADIPADCLRIEADGGLIAPGFVDLQNNGGGGVQFNDDPSVAAIRTMIAAHARGGVTAMLPTLITDTPDVTEAAIAAVRDAIAAGVPGCLGLHLEGPHLSLARKGAHRPDLIRPMTRADREKLVATGLAHLVVTVAAEAATPDDVGWLSSEGVDVSIGHSDASMADANQAIWAGAGLVTHLFNAMSPLGSREPGLVGAALCDQDVYAGLIADGHHVAPETIALALRAKRGPGKLFLVTDAMATAGSPIDSFEINGRTVRRVDGRLTLPDGTLAGSDLTMDQAVRYAVNMVGLPVDEALRMASLYPAMALCAHVTHGRIAPGRAADLVWLDEALAVQGVWIAGERVAWRR